MSSDRVGLDPIAVEELERAMERAATTLAPRLEALRRAALRLAWDGEDRVLVLRRVERVRRSGDAATRRLRHAASALRAHRMEQEWASLATVPLGAPAPAGSGDPAGGGLDAITAGLMTHRRVESLRARLDLPLRAVELGAELHLTVVTTHTRDGRVEVELHAEGGAGIGAALGEHAGGHALAGGVLGATYEFRSPEEATRFLTGLRRALVPRLGLHDHLALTAMLPLGAARLPRLVERQVADHLRDHRRRRTSVHYGIRHLLRAEAGEGRTDGEAAVEGRYERTHHDDGTVTTARGLAISAELQALGIAVEGDLRARLVSTSTGHRLVLDGELATHRDLDRFLTWAGGGLVQLGTDATGGGASFEATLDLTPANEALLRDLALHPTDGRAGDRLRAIIDRSELVVQRSDVHHRESGVDVVVGEAAIEGTDLRARQTWVKPSGGGLVEVP